MENKDKRFHMSSFLMRESLLDDRVLEGTLKAETPTVRMLPDVRVIKIGSSSIVDRGKSAVYPLMDVCAQMLKEHRIIFGCGGGARSKHVFSVGVDLGLPTGVLAQISVADALGNAHILGTLLAQHGVVAIPPEIFGHLLPLFINTVPGGIFNRVPPYSNWEHPPKIGRIPPHRSDAGCFILGECFGVDSVILVKDVDGLYTKDPKDHDDAVFIPEATASEVEAMNLETLPFDRVLLDILKTNRLMKQFQIVNGLKPELVARAAKGEHVGTIIRADQ